MKNALFAFLFQIIRAFTSWLTKANIFFTNKPAKADETSPFCGLPEDCIGKIISMTSPKDACTAAAVSQAFRSSAENDGVWERFLPPDYKEIISGSDPPVAFSNKKELYFLLCDSALLVAGGKMSFRLNSRSTGKKCFMLSARELEIAWIDNPTHWEWTSWTSLPESRFAEVAELRSVCWLDIRGTFRSQTLSANTNYTALLVFKLSTGYYGLQNASKASVKFVKDGTTTKTEGDGIKIVSIVPPRMYLMGRRTVPPGMNPKGWLTTIREDGWHEIKLGNFFVDEGNECDVQIQLYETERLHWKKGLIIEGIEVRPKGTFWNSTRRLC